MNLIEKYLGSVVPIGDNYFSAAVRQQHRHAGMDIKPLQLPV